ncbi:hypothetical protein BEN47_08710 [Hymenobacter lapidarius]|uniref:Uncharacterized protein n=1 Tax=Hymenobacter lapidarius TaxID=1908237 RepID=A0A1G1TC05_9BACT|nr:hypothetical protein [Hymenobacter lapidarius]OGX88417.1 hypothetical protein BEN47_08710 [Hymenobacter lapidarius]
MPRRKSPLAKLFKKVIGNGYTWAWLAVGFLIGCGWLMERNGVKDFPYADKHGKAQNGSPELLYIMGGCIAAMTLLQAILFRVDELKTERARAGTKDTLLPDD